MGSIKVRAGGGIVAVAAVAAVVASVYATGAPNPTKDNTYKLAMRVDFEPKQRIKLPKVDEVVLVVVSCTCAINTSERVLLSPWRRTIEVPKNAKVTLTATQQINGTLSCSMNGVKQETTDFAGSVVCVHPAG